MTKLQNSDERNQKRSKQICMDWKSKYCQDANSSQLDL